MPKKVSKRSRAARRGEIPDDTTTKSIQQQKEPISNNDGLKKSIIRTQIKNENLLNKKLESSKIKKNKRKSSTTKTKVERNSKLQGILANKIDSSIARATYIQNARKSNWDKTNSNIELKNHMIDDFKIEPTKELTEEEIEKLEEDEIVRKFYEDREINVDDDDKQKDEREDEQNGEDEEDKPDLSNNKFALLDEVEA
ncbi:ECM1 [Candida jiufengensis]|uniref:ECM1 n=1 Tax=Candida jiufengensis TaxID=497108 RepID=UPI00222555C3|nr:ECM1 [Candida jiufengensis]KAI5955078.1 ECM1 [Candida jiufengensis]